MVHRQKQVEVGRRNCHSKGAWGPVLWRLQTGCNMKIRCNMTNTLLNTPYTHPFTRRLNWGHLVLHVGADCCFSAICIHSVNGLQSQVESIHLQTRRNKGLTELQLHSSASTHTNKGIVWVRWGLNGYLCWVGGGCMVAINGFWNAHVFIFIFFSFYFFISDQEPPPGWCAQRLFFIYLFMKCDFCVA